VPHAIPEPDVAELTMEYATKRNPETIKLQIPRIRTSHRTSRRGGGSVGSIWNRRALYRPMNRSGLRIGMRLPHHSQKALPSGMGVPQTGHRRVATSARGPAHPNLCMVVELSSPVLSPPNASARRGAILCRR
jgi:hypothetical protein